MSRPIPVFRRLVQYKKKKKEKKKVNQRMSQKRNYLIYE